LEAAKIALDCPLIARRPTWLIGGQLLADGLDELADKVLGGIEQVFERAAIIRMPAAAGDVGGDVHHCGFEAVEPIVEPAEIVVGDDRLAIGKAK
jgi:hypothetical protein